MTDVVGLVLAAGAGDRFGGPKSLARTPDGEPWVARAVRVLLAGGCDAAVVVLGAGADEAEPLVPPEATVVRAAHWRSGMGASLAEGIAALPEADAALISLVDLPGMPPAVVERVLERGVQREALVRAAYDDRPGHPVLLGRDHWDGFREALHGDEGGRRYLELHDVAWVECSDLYDGEDVDRR
ncbi:nucleotidyltransferase family protein [Amnibacterium setariae]|uniref:Nucleotidyltransferase family protein n=1 Tax=Amnibacterium setariae TaxID=2306585 RepID=A0A3A1TRW4_9MICO|nr:nucleotidyltransferase family protein [Amnibacterium setariae]RIX26426.1 nucleotidyltransferase family protein [Amnibacterium setariae]